MPVSLVAPLQAQTSPVVEPVLTIEDIAAACVRGEAETLPLPFTDLDVNHWAFESVMNLYYGCFAHKIMAQQQSLDQTAPLTGFSRFDARNHSVEVRER